MSRLDFRQDDEVQKEFRPLVLPLTEVKGPVGLTGRMSLSRHLIRSLPEKPTHAMCTIRPGGRLSRWNMARTPVPGEGQIRVKVSACGVLPDRPSCRRMGSFPHQISDHSRSTKSSAASTLSAATWTTHQVGDRVGIPWLGYTCGVCRFCKQGMENLCDHPLFTGYMRDGGFATHTIADARYAFPLGERRR